MSEKVEQYEYQIGDKGVLSNGIDTYRIVCIDSKLHDPELTILALVISNFENNEGVIIDYEQSKSFRANGWGVPRLGLKLGSLDYDLTPPEVSINE